MTKQKIRVIELPTGALVIQKIENNTWKKDFSISPIEQNICSICGHPISPHEVCSYHFELSDLPIEFSLCYGGYYQSDLNHKPLNEYSRRIQYFNTKDIDLILNILIKRWNTLPDKNDYHWITTIPTRNKAMPKLAKLFARQFELLYIPCEDLFNYTSIKSIRYEKKKITRKQLIKDKYSINLPKLQNTKSRISGNGVIMDDVLNTGATISYILELLNNHLTLSKVKGLVFARTKGKKVRYVKFPKQ